MNNLRSKSFNDTVPMASEEIRRTDSGFGERHILNDDGGLSSFHRFEEEEEGGTQGKLIGGALVVALLLGAAGIYAYTGNGSNPAGMIQKAPVSSMASNIPTAPVQSVPMTPPAATPAPDATASPPTPSPYDTASTPAPASDTASAAPDVKAGTPVKSARAHIVKQNDEAAQNTAEAGQTAQLNRDSSAADRATKNGSVAVPLSAAPSSSVAGNGQTGAPADNSATPPADAAQADLPTPPSPPASSMASNGQPVTPEASGPAQDVPAASPSSPEQQPATAPAVPAPQPEQPQAVQAQPQ